MKMLPFMPISSGIIRSMGPSTPTKPSSQPHSGSHFVSLPFLLLDAVEAQPYPLPFTWWLTLPLPLMLALVLVLVLVPRS